MHVFSTLDPVYLNARAEECTAVAKDRGVRTVWYRGGVYSVIGYYLASHQGERVLCYILRSPTRFEGAHRRANNGAPYAPRNE